MISFLVCLAALIISYFTYGKIVEKIYGPDNRETPAVAMSDGVDYVVMPKWRVFLVQLLNIAGLGPIYGALMGAVWGPAVFLWITLGTVFAGAVHDFSIGFMSMRHKGVSVSELTGMYLGKVMRLIMRIFSVVLLVMVGVVFAVGPAGLIAMLIGNKGGSGLLANTYFWLAIIIVYYFIATFVPVDKVIGKIYPLFGLCLIIMAIGVVIGLFVHGYEIPEVTLKNLHPAGTPIWPVLFITVACGAISGFHATQSPLMARCCSSEKETHVVFYGAMVSEGIIALVWAAAGCAVYSVSGGLMTGLFDMLGSTGQAGTVYDISLKTMGSVGVVLAMVGVIACPITSGDTAFRSARLVISDWFKIDQAKYKNRLFICVPLFAVAILISQLNYDVVWRYFSWSNQTLAMIALWTASVYLYKNHKMFLITMIPATFMAGVSATYFFYADECLGFATSIAYPAGAVFAGICLIIFLARTVFKRESASENAKIH